MTYTPINWQTGDTITAEKMNKMDNGWSVSSTQLFSETVTTADQGGMYSAQLAYSGAIDADTITVTFDSTEYTCQRIDAFGGYYYGGFTESGPDFSTYPFALGSNSGGMNRIFTQSAGTYPVIVSSDSVEASSGFAAAVAVASSPELLVATANVTTWQEIYDALAAGKVVCINSASGSNVYSEPVYSATFDGTNYEVAAFFVDGGGTSARYYTAASADSAIIAN